MTNSGAVISSLHDEAVFAALMQQGSLYELVDPLIADPGFGGAGGFEDCAFIDNPFIDHPKARRLRLQPVTTPAASVWRNLHANSQPLMPDEARPLCAWLVSRQPISSMARHLSRYLEHRKPSGRNALLRYYDPRVMQRLAFILTPSQLSALLGPVDHWVFMDHSGMLRVISPHAGMRHLGHITIDEGQWAAIDRIGQVNRTLLECSRLTPLSSVDDSDLHDIDRLLAIAEQEGVDEASRTTFALHGLGSTVNFHRHPYVQDVLTRCQQGESYQKLTQGWSHETWQTINESNISENQA